MPCPGHNLPLPSRFWKEEQKPRDWPPLTTAGAEHSSAQGGLPPHPLPAVSGQITTHLPPVGLGSGLSPEPVRGLPASTEFLRSLGHPQTHSSLCPRDELPNETAKESRWNSSYWELSAARRRRGCPLGLGTLRFVRGGVGHSRQIPGEGNELGLVFLQ